MENVLGNLDMRWLWKGTRGKWHEILTTRVTAAPGSILTPTPEYSPIEFDTDTRNFIPQVRDIISRNVRGPQDDCSSSKVEARGLAPDESDRAFALQFQFLGRGCLTGYRMAADNVPQNTEGADSEPETGLHILPGGDACPELIEGATPDYTIQPENPTGAFIGFPTQEQTHFATADLTNYQAAPKNADSSQPANNTRIVYVCLNDATGNWDLTGDSYTSLVDSKVGPVFNGNPTVTPWVSVVSFVLPSNSIYGIDAIKTAVGAQAVSRVVRLRVILDSIIYTPLPDTGPGGSIVLDSDLSPTEPLASIQHFTFST